MFPGIWRHGDWIEITSRGTAIIYGRSDSTINRGGVRMGTSEIYRAVLGLDEITDALVVDVPRPGTEGWMPLFVVLREDVALDDELEQRIAAKIRADCSPRHVPNEVHEIAEVPRTLSGKVLEVPVKRILMGTPAEQAASRDSLANPRRSTGSSNSRSRAPESRGDRAVAPVGLRLVERGVGGSDQRRRRRAGLGVARNAAARGQPVLAELHLHAAAQALGERERAGRVAVGRDDRELLAADPRDAVLGASLLVQDAAEPLQRPVPVEVARARR